MLQPKPLTSGANIPQPGDMIVAACDQVFAIRTYGDSIYCIGMAEEQSLTAGMSIPKAGCLIEASRGEPFAVSTDREGADDVQIL